MTYDEKAAAAWDIANASSEIELNELGEPESRFTPDELDRLDWLGAHPHGFI